MIQLPTKHSTTGNSIFSVMSSLAQQYLAINLSQGFPDYPIDERLAALLGEAARKDFNQYSPMPGLPALRQAVSAGFRTRYGIEVDPDTEITITPGATYGIYTALTAILQPGDKVIVLEPAYDSYIPNIEMNGAIAIPVALEAPGFRVDWNKIKAAIGPGVKAIIVNTPHNPSGAIWEQADWDTLADLVRDTEIIIISDEVYEQLVFDGYRHYSVLQHPELRLRSFAIFSFGKVYHNTGWKIGYCIAPPDFTTAFRRLHQFIAYNVNTPGQYALAAHLGNDHPVSLSQMMQQKRDYFLNLLQQTPFVVHEAARGSYFQVVGYGHFSDLPDMEFARWLTMEYGVATIPLSAFYQNKKDDHLVRFCFAKKEETLAAAISRLSALQG